MGFWDDVGTAASTAGGYALGGPIGGLVGGALGSGSAGGAWNGIQSAFGIGSGDPTNADRGALEGNAGQANQFGQQAAGQFQGADTQNLAAQRAYLQQLANGQHSVSAEQLRQGLQQTLAQQQSQAAGASPQNAAMAARTAANNMARLGYGMTGQQAIAGLQEQNNANSQLAQMNLGQRGQDLQGALGGYGAANQGYGSAIQNPQKPVGPALLGAAQGIGSMIAMSDRRLKNDIADADDKASQVMSGLKAYTFKYKNDKHGKGEQFGVMAQDLEKAGLGHAVVDTDEGKAVHGAKLATANTAMIAALARRVGNIENRK